LQDAYNKGFVDFMARFLGWMAKKGLKWRKGRWQNAGVARFPSPRPEFL